MSAVTLRILAALAAAALVLAFVSSVALVGSQNAKSGEVARRQLISYGSR